MSPKDCDKAFLIGYLHDVGYEVADASTHSASGYNMLKNAYELDIPEILHHGDPLSIQTLFLRILNTADMTIDAKGNKVTINERLKDIKTRHGETSEVYKNACLMRDRLLNNY